MTAPDGKQRLTDVADTEQLLRLIQSIPSPKAEPFKRWLAKAGYERLKEIENPEFAAAWRTDICLKVKSTSAKLLTVPVLGTIICSVCGNRAAECAY